MEIILTLFFVSSFIGLICYKPIAEVVYKTQQKDVENFSLKESISIVILSVWSIVQIIMCCIWLIYGPYPLVGAAFIVSLLSNWVFGFKDNTISEIIYKNIIYDTYVLVAVVLTIFIL